MSYDGLIAEFVLTLGRTYDTTATSNKIVTHTSIPEGLACRGPTTLRF
jgi:hypothetical protein